MQRTFLVYLSLLLSFFLIAQVEKAQATPELAVMVGFKQNSVVSTVDGYTATAKVGYLLGGVAVFPMSDLVSIRSGFIYNQRNFNLETTGSKVEYAATYFDIPFTAFFKMSEFGGVFVGPVLAMNLTNECTNSTGQSCSATGTQSMLVPITIGGHFKFAPQMGGEFYFETAGGGVSDQAKAYKAVGLNFLITFE